MLAIGPEDDWFRRGALGGGYNCRLVHLDGWSKFGLCRFEFVPFLANSVCWTDISVKDQTVLLCLALAFLSYCSLKKKKKTSAGMSRIVGWMESMNIINIFTGWNWITISKNIPNIPDFNLSRHNILKILYPDWGNKTRMERMKTKLKLN